jgi:hypothetical protein
VEEILEIRRIWAREIEIGNRFMLAGKECVVVTAESVDGMAIEFIPAHTRGVEDAIPRSLLVVPEFFPFEVLN